MKITKSQLQQIIKEEISQTLVREHPHDNSSMGGPPGTPITPAFRKLKTIQTSFRRASDDLRQEAEDYDVDGKLIGAYNLAINNLINAIFSASATEDLEAQSTTP